MINFNNKKTRKLAAIVTLVVIVAMVLTSILPAFI